MEEHFYMAYRVINIDHFIQMIVFPVPKLEEIEKDDFSYSNYIKDLLTKLKEAMPADRLNILNEWSSPKKIHPYDIALAKIQIDYERALRLGLTEEIISDIYTEQMKEVIEKYRCDSNRIKAILKEEELKRKFEEIKRTSKERFDSFLEGKIKVTELYLWDLRKMNRNPHQRKFKRMFCARLDMGIQDELTELELETMTLKEIWTYNKKYIEEKKKKRSKIKQKKSCKSKKKVV